MNKPTRFMSFAAMGLAGAMLAACGGSNETDVNETNGSIGQSPPVNAVQDAAAGPTGVVTAVVVGGDTEAYLRNAALGNMYEIQAGQLALEKGGSEEIRQIGQMIIDDHTALQTAMQNALADASVEFTPPTELDERRQGMIDNLRAASDTTFDSAFLHQQEAAHMEAITLHESYEARGDMDAIQAAARQAQPVIREHLDMLHDSLGAAADGE